MEKYEVVVSVYVIADDRDDAVAYVDRELSDVEIFLDHEINDCTPEE